VGPRDAMDDVEKRKFLTLRGLELRPSVVQPIGSRYTDFATAAHILSAITTHNSYSGKCSNNTWECSINISIITCA
jgi:hypothetical protein